MRRASISASETCVHTGAPVNKDGAGAWLEGRARRRRASRKSMNSQGPTMASKAWRLDSERGKPSMRNGPSDRDIALRSKPTVVSDTTILPSSHSRRVISQ